MNMSFWGSYGLTFYLKYISGEIAPVGPTSFEFMVPKDAPVTICPSVGTIQPGKVLTLYHTIPDFHDDRKRGLKTL